MRDFELSTHHLALKTRLTPVLARLHGFLDAQVGAHTPCLDMIEEVKWHTTRMPEQLKRLGELIETGLAPLALSGGDEGQASEVMGQLSAWIETWGERMLEVRSLHPDPEERDARDWLAAAYRRTLMELDAGLMALLGILENPAAAFDGQRLPKRGTVTVLLTITLTAGPEVEALAAWVQKRRRQLLPSERQTRRQGLGFWGWVGAIALGSWIGSSLADDDCDS